MVNPYILVALDDLWRPHTLDHFSNYRTHQITRFCSLWLNPCTHRSGCLHTLLVGGEQLDFVSPYLIPRGLEHMEQGMEMGTLIITLWTSAHRCYKTDWVQIPPYEDMFLPVTPSASLLSGIPCYRVLALWSRNYFGSHANNTRHKSLKQEPFVLNFLQISYIHSSHLCSHSNVPLSFPNVEPSIFLEH